MQLAVRIKRKRKTNEEFGLRLGKLSRRKVQRKVFDVSLEIVSFSQELFSNFQLLYHQKSSTKHFSTVCGIKSWTFGTAFPMARIFRLVKATAKIQVSFESYIIKDF